MTDRAQGAHARSVAYAKELRARATPAEVAMCRLLDTHRISYVFQSNLCDLKTGRIYIADFRLRCQAVGRPKGMPRRDWRRLKPTRVVFVEIDGSSHLGREGYDARRTQWIKRHRGGVVVRVSNEDVFNRPDYVMSLIHAHKPALKTVRRSYTSAWRGIIHAAPCGRPSESDTAPAPTLSPRLVKTPAAKTP